MRNRKASQAKLRGLGKSSWKTWSAPEHPCKKPFLISVPLLFLCVHHTRTTPLLVVKHNIHHPLHRVAYQAISTQQLQPSSSSFQAITLSTSTPSQSHPTTTTAYKAITMCFGSPKRSKYDDVYIAPRPATHRHHVYHNAPRTSHLHDHIGGHPHSARNSRTVVIDQRYARPTSGVYYAPTPRMSNPRMSQVSQHHVERRSAHYVR